MDCTAHTVALDLDAEHPVQPTELRGSNLTLRGSTAMAVLATIMQSYTFTLMTTRTRRLVVLVEYCLVDLAC